MLSRYGFFPFIPLSNGYWIVMGDLLLNALPFHETNESKYFEPLHKFALIHHVKDNT